SQQAGCRRARHQRGNGANPPGQDHGENEGGLLRGAGANGRRARHTHDSLAACAKPIDASVSAPAAIDLNGRYRVTDSGSYIVAVVDDDQRILQSLETLLESADYSVRLYASAESLLEDADVLAELDCLISDIGLSLIDGFELLRLVKSARPDLPVILITG